MPTPKTIESKTLPFDDSPLAVAYGAIIDHVKADTALATAKVAIESTPYKFDPSVLQRLPLLIIELGGGPIESRTAVRDDNGLSIAFTCYVRDGNHIDLLNMDAAVRRTIKPRSCQWLADALAGVAELADLRWVTPAATYEPLKESRVLKGTAVLQVRITPLEC